MYLETQVLVSLFKSDLYRTLRECAKGNLNTSQVCFEKDKFAVAVVIAAHGYPGSFEKGMKIKFTAEEKVTLIMPIMFVFFSRSLLFFLLLRNTHNQSHYNFQET